MGNDNNHSEENEPQSYNNAFLIENNKSQKALIESLLNTTEKQAKIITEQYSEMKDISTKMYDLLQQNNQITKAIYEATITLPNHVKTVQDELKTIIKDTDTKAFSRYEVLRDNIFKVQKDIKSIQMHINIKTSSYGYTEETPSSFSPGGNRGM